MRAEIISPVFFYRSSRLRKINEQVQMYSFYLKLFCFLCPCLALIHLQRQTTTHTHTFIHYTTIFFLSRSVYLIWSDGIERKKFTCWREFPAGNSIFWSHCNGRSICKTIYVDDLMTDTEKIDVRRSLCGCLWLFVLFSLAHSFFPYFASFPSRFFSLLSLYARLISFQFGRGHSQIECIIHSFSAAMFIKTLKIFYQSCCSYFLFVLLFLSCVIV